LRGAARDNRKRFRYRLRYRYWQSFVHPRSSAKSAVLLRSLKGFPSLTLNPSPHSWQGFACGGWGEGGYSPCRCFLFVSIRVRSPACRSLGAGRWFLQPSIHPDTRPSPFTATIGVGVAIGIRIGIERKREPGPGRGTDSDCCGVGAGKGQQGNDTDTDCDTDSHSFIRDHPRNPRSFSAAWRDFFSLTLGPSPNRFRVSPGMKDWEREEVFGRGECNVCAFGRSGTRWYAVPIEGW
jgi:hypothetical protein